MAALTLRIADLVSGETAFRTFGRSPVRIGRGEANDLMLATAGISQNHGVLRFSASDWSYVDLGSKNGTVVDGDPAPSRRRVALRIGSELRLGTALIVVESCDQLVEEVDEKDTAFPSGSAEGHSDDVVPMAQAFSPRTQEWFDAVVKDDQMPVSPMQKPDVGHPGSVSDEASMSPGSYVAGGTKLAALLPVRPSQTPIAETSVQAEELRIRLMGAVENVANADDRALLRHAVLALHDLIAGVRSMHLNAAEKARAFGLGDGFAGDPNVATGLLRLLGEEAEVGRRELSTALANLQDHQSALVTGARIGMESLVERIDPSQFARRARGLRSAEVLDAYSDFFDEEVAQAWSNFVRPAVARAQGESLSRREAERSDNFNGVVSRLTVTSSDLFQAKSFELHGAEMVVGRAHENAICLDHSSVSRQHARLSCHGAVWTITDLNSSNGIFVNSRKYRTAPLRDGDLVEIGLIKLRFETCRPADAP